MNSGAHTNHRLGCLSNFCTLNERFRAAEQAFMKFKSPWLEPRSTCIAYDSELTEDEEEQKLRCPRIVE